MPRTPFPDCAMADGHSREQIGSNDLATEQMAGRQDDSAESDRAATVQPAYSCVDHNATQQVMRTLPLHAPTASRAGAPAGLQHQAQVPRPSSVCRFAVFLPPFVHPLASSEAQADSALYPTHGAALIRSAPVTHMLAPELRSRRAAGRSQLRRCAIRRSARVRLWTALFLHLGAAASLLVLLC